MTLDQAKSLTLGQTIYHTSKTNVDGTPMRAKVLSVKTWKRSPYKVIVSVKRGLRDFATFNESELDSIRI